MKKNYLFDKILLDCGKGIKFKPFRSVSLLESFMANCHSTFNQEEWEFIPVNEKDFLKMLSMTIVKIGNSDYEILSEECESISFDTLLQNFIWEIYKTKKPDEKEMKEFYQKAYDIRKTAINERELLNKKPNEFIQDEM